METPFQKVQDIKFVNSIKDGASLLLDLADRNLGLQKEWNNLFGGASRLETAIFEGQNEGIVKQDIADALSVLSALNTWLDTDSNRSMLEKIRVAFSFPPRF